MRRCQKPEVGSRAARYRRRSRVDSGPNAENSECALYSQLSTVLLSRVPATHGVCTARQAGRADPMERQGVTRSMHHARRKKLSRHGACVAGKI
jgi:hypothetical protein